MIHEVQLNALGLVQLRKLLETQAEITGENIRKGNLGAEEMLRLILINQNLHQHILVKMMLREEKVG